MSGINPGIVFSIAQICTEFVDDIGNVKSGTGTGFYFRASNPSRAVLVTNRHNVDPHLRLGARWSLSAVKLRLRNYVRGVPCEETRWFPIDMQKSRWKHSATADVSILVEQHFQEHLGDYGFSVMVVNLATQEFFERKAQIMDFVSFIGYPGSSGQPWWDERWNTPIARMATLASSPSVPFTHGSISTSDATLVSGLSFAGSSGSPVLGHQKGVYSTGDVVDTSFTPATLLGIMSGHWWSAAEEPMMFRHSGLSYFTRATSIAELLAAD